LLWIEGGMMEAKAAMLRDKEIREAMYSNEW
jgi:hypothetical protein